MESRFLGTTNLNLDFKNTLMEMQQLREVMRKKNLILMKVALLLISNKIKF
jgi:hypothetical protein